MRPALDRARGGLRLGMDVTGAVGAVGLDAVRDLRGAALPSTPEALAEPEVLGRLLGRAVRSAELPGVDFESSNCRNFLLDVTYADGEAVTMYAKLPATQFGPRVFANALGYWALECTFGRDVAPHVQARIPGVYAVERRGSRFVLLLEDVSALPSARTFVNRDTAAGTTEEQARRVLTAFAELHAPFHGWDATARERVLPMALHPFVPRGRRPVTRSLNLTAVTQAHRKAPELVGDDVVRIYRRTLEHWDELVDHWYSGALTLAHGDSHLANCFEYDDVGGARRVGFLDFQGVHWSPGIRDVVYFLVNSMDPALLAQLEVPLVEHYLAELRARGVDLDFDSTWELYRSFAFQVLVVGVVAVGLGGFTEREDTVRTMLLRQLAGLERLGYADLLEELIAR